MIYSRSVPCFKLIKFQEFFKLLKDAKIDHFSSEHFLYKLIMEKGVQDTLPNVDTTFRIYLLLMISN